MHGSAVVVGVGESEYYQARRRPPHRVPAGVHRHPQRGGRRRAHAGRRRRVRVLHGPQRAGAPERRPRRRRRPLHGPDLRRRRQRRRRRRVAGRRRHHRRLRRDDRGVPLAGPGPVRALRPAARRAPGRRGRRVHGALRDAVAGPDLRHADHALHARARGDAGQPGRGGAHLLRARPAQPAGHPLRHAAHRRGVPRVALDHVAVPPLRLLPRERRCRRHRRHDGRAGARPGQAAGRHRGRRPRAAAPATACPRSASRTSRRPTTARSAQQLWQRAGAGAGRRGRGPVLRELQRPGAHGHGRDGVLRARGRERVRRRRPAAVARRRRCR